jgi:hypothetical protein
VVVVAGVEEAVLGDVAAKIIISKTNSLKTQTYSELNKYKNI